MAAIERTMTVALRRDFIDTPTYKRAKKAASSLREQIMKQMKATDVKIGKFLNLKLWEKGMRNPAHKVTFIAKKDDKGVVTAELANIPVKKQKSAKVPDKKAEKPASPEAAETPKVAAPAETKP